MANTQNNTKPIPAMLQSRRRKLDSLDRERGDCLQIYKDKATWLVLMPDDWQSAVVKALLRWFAEGVEEGDAKREAVATVAEDESMSIAEREKAKKKILFALTTLMDSQRNGAAKYLAKCEKNLISASKRWHSTKRMNEQDETTDEDEMLE